MKPEIRDVVVMRVTNGWVVRPSRDTYSNGHEAGEIHVARTPGELAQLLTDWAMKQQRGGEA